MLTRPRSKQRWAWFHLSVAFGDERSLFVVQHEIEGYSESGSTDEDLGPGNGVEGWATLAKTMTEYDEIKIRDCKEDMDTLLVFVSISFMSESVC